MAPMANRRASELSVRLGTIHQETNGFPYQGRQALVQGFARDHQKGTDVRRMKNGRVTFQIFQNRIGADVWSEAELFAQMVQRNTGPLGSQKQITRDGNDANHL
jgi:hypothetical protein